MKILAKDRLVAAQREKLEKELADLQEQYEKATDSNNVHKESQIMRRIADITRKLDSKTLTASEKAILEHQLDSVEDRIERSRKHGKEPSATDSLEERVLKNTLDNKLNVKELSADDSNQSAFISCDITLFIRLLEVAREELKSDEALHQLVERCSETQAAKGAFLSMDDYSSIMG